MWKSVIVLGCVDLKGDLMAKRLPVKVKELLEKAKESCVLAVDVYNKPRTSFRSGAYIVLMVIAWTALFHAIFQREGVKYYYRKKNSIRYKKTPDGEKMAWELTTCVKKYFENKDKKYEPVRNNINFFIRFRNQIEHRFMPELDNEILSECQPFLNNFEEILSEEFGEYHNINESLVYSLQFTHLNSKSKEFTPSKDFIRIKNQIREFRDSLSPEVISSPQYRFQAILIRTTNPNKADYTIKVIDEEDLDPDQMRDIKHAIGITTEKIRSVSNVGHLIAKDVVKDVQRELKSIHSPKIRFNSYHHKICCLEYQANKGKKSKNKLVTDDNFCIYDEAFEDYTYTTKWIKYLIKKLGDNEEFLRLFPKQKKVLLGLFSSVEVSKKVKKELSKFYGPKIKFGYTNNLKCALNYGIRPPKGNEPKNETNSDYCFYDENDTYLYTQKWIDLLINNLKDETEFLNIFPNQKDLIRA